MMERKKNSFREWIFISLICLMMGCLSQTAEDTTTTYSQTTLMKEVQQQPVPLPEEPVEEKGDVSDEPTWVQLEAKKADAGMEDIRGIEEKSKMLNILKIKYNEKEYYLFTPDDLNVPSILYDADGNIFCAPYGGKNGNGDGKCPKDLYQKLEPTELLWDKNPNANL